MGTDLILIGVSLFTWGIGEGLFYYFLPLSLQQWGADPLKIGAVYGGIGIAIAIAQIPSGLISDRINPKYIMWASWIIGTVATWMMAMSTSMTMFVAGVWMYYFTAFVMAPLNKLITQVRGKLKVERALSLIGGLFNLGAVAGPILGGLLAKEFGLGKIYYFSACIFIFSTLIIFFLKSKNHEREKEETAKSHLLKNSRFATFLLLSFLTVMFMYLPQPLTPNFLQNQRNLSITTVGLLGTIGNFGNAFATLVLGSLSAPVGLIVGQVMVLVFGILLWKGNQTWMFGLGYFLLGGYRLARTMIVSLTQSFVRLREMGLAFGILETICGFAIILSPVIAGWLYEKNPQAPYILGGSLIIITIILDAIFVWHVRTKAKIQEIVR